MSDPTALGIEGPVGALHLAVGLAVYLLPGVAGAWRWMPGDRLRVLWAPIWSVSLVTLATVLSSSLGAPVTATWTLGTCLALAILVSWPLLRAWLARARHGGAASLQVPPASSRAAQHAPERRSRMAWRAGGVVAVVAFVVAVAAIPHLGPGTPAPGGPYGQLATRIAEAGAGHGDPYPLHADEHLHIAWAAAIDRSGQASPDDPYTGIATGVGLATVESFVREAGFHVALAQWHQVTGLAFPAIALFLPALWAGYLALALWLTLRPSPGALASAALVGTLHSTARFLGPAFLVPSAFALPWILAAITATLRGRGSARLLAMVVLVVAAFFLHILLGSIVLVATLLAALLRPAPWSTRVGTALVAMAPLAWIVPAVVADLQAGATATTHLPVAPEQFLAAGFLVPAFAAIGIAVAAWPRKALLDRLDLAPHRVLAALLAVLATSMVGAVLAGNPNDALYARLVHAAALCAAALAGLGMAWTVQRLLALAKAPATPQRGRWRSWPLAPLGCFVLVAAGLAHPLAAHLQEPMYHVYDERSWTRLEGVVASGAGRNDTLLMDPLEAPLASGLTGAKAWDVLRPGSPVVHGADWADYVASGGKDAAWLRARGITIVAAAFAPTDGFTRVGRDVYMWASRPPNQR